MQEEEDGLFKATAVNGEDSCVRPRCAGVGDEVCSKSASDTPIPPCNCARGGGGKQGERNKSRVQPGPGGREGAVGSRMAWGVISGCRSSRFTPPRAAAMSRCRRSARNCTVVQWAARGAGERGTGVGLLNNKTKKE
jgi:hypothetical protein